MVKSSCLESGLCNKRSRCEKPVRQEEWRLLTPLGKLVHRKEDSGHPKEKEDTPTDLLYFFHDFAFSGVRKHI